MHDGLATLHAQPFACVSTTAAHGSGLASEEQAAREDREAWQRIIDDFLIEWGKDPSTLDDEEIVPPSREIIHAASQVAIALRDGGEPAPLRVVPDGDGGIAFEYRSEGWFRSLSICEDGWIELVHLVDCQEVSRRRIARWPTT